MLPSRCRVRWAVRNLWSQALKWGSPGIPLDQSSFSAVLKQQLPEVSCQGHLWNAKMYFFIVFARQFIKSTRYVSSQGISHTVHKSRVIPARINDLMWRRWTRRRHSASAGHADRLWTKNMIFPESVEVKLLYVSIQKQHLLSFLSEEIASVI